MVLDNATRRRLSMSGSGAARQCVDIARREGAWTNKGNGGAKTLPRLKGGARGVELVTQLAQMVANGFMNETEACKILDKHGL